MTRWLCVLILLTGCAAKKKNTFVVAGQYVTPECVRFKLSHECPLLPNGLLDKMRCPVDYEILCIKVKEK